MSLRLRNRTFSMIYPFFSVEISAVIWVEGSWLTDLGIKVFHIPLLHFFLSWATVVLNLCPGEKRVCSSTPKKLRHFSFSFLFPFFFLKRKVLSQAPAFSTQAALSSPRHVWLRRHCLISYPALQISYEYLMKIHKMEPL